MYAKSLSKGMHGCQHKAMTSHNTSSLKNASNPCKQSFSCLSPRLLTALSLINVALALVIAALQLFSVLKLLKNCQAMQAKFLTNSLGIFFMFSFWNFNF